MIIIMIIIIIIIETFIGGIKYVIVKTIISKAPALKSITSDSRQKKNL